MSRLAQDGSKDPRVRQMAESITRQVFDHDFMSEYSAIYYWVKANVRYVRDPVLVEQVQTPWATIQVRQGDCDDMATLIAGLIGAIGGRSRFVAGAFKYRRGRPVLEHVWVEAHDPRSNNWIVLDPVPGRKVGQMLGNLQHTITHPAVE
ncbi:MAG: transglutaminase domain-containing protein [Deltaproteobacteria bacterium]|nr:transglutaminase domain-containing protein [Deltaproteobacteria bacterium]